MPTVTAIILAWGEEPVLEESVLAVLASTDVEVDVLLVDNGCTSDSVKRLTGHPGVTVLDPKGNLGFAGGCNYGAARATGEVLAFINGDAVVRPEALSRLVAALGDDVGLASASLRLYDDPDTMNSAGNPVHYLGLSWAGGLGRPASDYTEPADITSATGAATVCRADRFAALGGFCEPMFAYCEDTELSLRCWQRGWRVVFVPDAVVLHRYEFSRNTNKMYLVERNRLFLVLTLFPARLIAMVLFPMLALEGAVLAAAVSQGWAKGKISGWWWLLRHTRLIRRRRKEVRSAQVIKDSEFARLLTGDFDPGVPGAAPPKLLQTASHAYWSVARRTI